MTILLAMEGISMEVRLMENHSISTSKVKIEKFFGLENAGTAFG